MANYPDKYPKTSFTTHVSITHDPTGFKFFQKGGRILVLQAREFDGVYGIVADFTTPEIQIEGTWLTEDKLRRAAITWLKDNAK